MKEVSVSCPKDSVFFLKKKKRDERRPGTRPVQYQTQGADLTEKKKKPSTCTPVTFICFSPASAPTTTPHMIKDKDHVVISAKLIKSIARPAGRRAGDGDPSGRADRPEEGTHGSRQVEAQRHALRCHDPRHHTTRRPP